MKHTSNLLSVSPRILMLLLCFIYSGYHYALSAEEQLDRSDYLQQNRQLTGKIIDSLGEGIIGANILEKGTTNGTITDFDGNFQLENVKPNATLVVTYVGFITQEIIVKDKNYIEVTLKEDLQSLDEVVVVGYGTQKKANLTGSVASVSVNELGKRQVGQTSLALQGLVPGISVKQNSGQPGLDGGVISIRGKTTLGDNNALILVDGVEMGINNIDASMIESISVLKDASSAAIYGSRAANGVILITTKRAKADRFSVSYNGYVGWQSAIELPKKVGALDHMNMMNLAHTNTGKSPIFSDDYIKEYAAGMNSNPDKYPNTDWIDEAMTNNGMMENHFLTLSGGSERIRALANIGYFNQNGLLENTNFKRYTFRVNLDMDITSKLSAHIDAHLAQTKRKEPSRGTGTAFHWLGRIPATQAGVLSDGKWGEGWNGDNPIAFTKDGGLREVENPSATLQFKLNYRPTDWLTFSGSYSPNYFETHDKRFEKAITSYRDDGSVAYVKPEISSLTQSSVRSLKNLVMASATAEKNFGVHGVKLLLGYQQEDQKTQGVGGYRQGYTFPDYPVLDAGGGENKNSWGGKSDWALRSFFGRVNYDFKERYLFEANLRYDGSSRFYKGHRWGVFPSFSGAWRISEESFWEDLYQIIPNFKLRASWGQLGNQNVGSLYPFSSDVNLGLDYSFDKEIASGAGVTTLANQEISWEKTTVTDLGLDLNLFGKLNITADYYFKKTTGILLNLDIPLIIGMGAPAQNAGVVENKGWDISMDYSDKIGEFNYRVGFNLSDVKNKIVDLKGVDQTGYLVNREGHEMNSIYGLRAIGYIQPEDFNEDGSYKYAAQYGSIAAGDIMYKDNNEDGVINTSDQEVLGGTIPRLTYGLTLSGEYKGFDLNVLLQGVGKANGYIFGQGIQPFYQGGTVQEQHKDYWTESNRNAKFPRLAFNEPNNVQHSSFWMKNASYMRLKNIQLGYSLPKSTLSKFHISNLRFYISGDNLLTFDNFWKGYDVEAPVGNGSFYPHVKTISFGVDFRF